MHWTTKLQYFVGAAPKNEYGFQGQEYLELYPTIDIDDVGKVTQLKKDVWGKFSSNERQWRQISGVLAEVG